MAWQESAGSLLLLAAATETGLLTQFSQALPKDVIQPRSSCPHNGLSAGQRLLLTLLFLGAVELCRPWDLRSYTGDGLALLTTRKRAYGYRYTEEFLARIAQAGGAECLTDALARWTARLWKIQDTGQEALPSTFYVDGHHKPVYTDVLIPRGLVGRLNAILGSRALVLLHDTQGHPLLTTTHRGDLHLTNGLHCIIERYEQATGSLHLERLVVDREGMATEFLAALQTAGRTVVTLLRTDQYRDLASFRTVGTFVPLSTDRHGKVVREVAPASIALPLPDHPDESLLLQVALIRDLSRQVPIRPSKEDEDQPSRWDADLDWRNRQWWKDDWQATPTPAGATTAKLIPIVTTASYIDAVELAQTYIHRWPAQENCIKDFLLPLGLDINHGFSKTQIEKSEVARRRTALEKRLTNVQRWKDAAGKRSQQAGKRHERLRQQLNARANALYRELNHRQDELVTQGVADHLLQREIKERKTVIDAELEQMRTRMWQAYEQCNQEFCKQERYCQKQRKLLRSLEDLKANERTMYELDQRKDQIMTVCKVALANLIMWVRDRYFPTTYVHATWQRLAPFFRLPGKVILGPETVQVELRPFNDRHLNRDLTALCTQVSELEPRLPDRRRLLFTVGGTNQLMDNASPQHMA